MWFNPKTQQPKRVCQMALHVHWNKCFLSTDIKSQLLKVLFCRTPRASRRGFFLGRNKEGATRKGNYKHVCIHDTHASQIGLLCFRQSSNIFWFLSRFYPYLSHSCYVLPSCLSWGSFFPLKGGKTFLPPGLSLPTQRSNVCLYSLPVPYHPTQWKFTSLLPKGSL